MIEYFAGLFIVIVGIYTMLVKDNFIKKLIGLSLVADGTHLLLMTIGFRRTLASAIPPIFVPGTMDYATFTILSVDPLPQALVLTSIVINLSVTAFALMLGLRIYEKTKTFRVREWSE